MVGVGGRNYATFHAHEIGPYTPRLRASDWIILWPANVPISV